MDTVHCCVCGEEVAEVYTTLVYLEGRGRMYSGHKRCLPSLSRLEADDSFEDFPYTEFTLG